MNWWQLWCNCRGAFKFRGACNAVLSLSDDEAQRGVVTHSRSAWFFFPVNLCLFLLSLWCLRKVWYPMMKVEGTLWFYSKPYFRCCHHVPGDVWNVSGARFFDSSKSYSCHQVCILNFSLRLLEEYSSLWHIVSASKPYFWSPHHAWAPSCKTYLNHFLSLSAAWILERFLGALWSCVIQSGNCAAAVALAPQMPNLPAYIMSQS